MYLIHSKQIKPLLSEVMHAQSEKTLSLWLRAAQRWPQLRRQFKITWPFCMVEAKSGKDRELRFYKSSGRFVEKWLPRLNSPRPLLPPWKFSARYPPRVKQRTCSFAGRGLWSLQDNLLYSTLSLQSSASKKSVTNQLQGRQQRSDVAVTHTFSNSHCASLWEEDSDWWPREQRRKKIF